MVMRASLIATGAVLACMAAYAVYQPAPDYVQDKARLATMQTLINLLRQAGRLVEYLGVAQAPSIVRHAFAIVKPTPKNTSSVIFSYRQFADSDTVVATPADHSRLSGSAIVYIHGGGFMYGAPELYEALAVQIVEQTGAVFLGIRYRLAPEHPFPAAFDDSLAAVEAIFDSAESMGIDPSRIAIAGDSAGGQLTAAIVQHLRVKQSRHRPKAQVMVYPAVQAVNLRVPSAVKLPRAPLMNAKDTPFLISLVFTGNKSKAKIFKHHGHVTPKVQAAYLAAVGEEIPIETDEETRRRYASPELESLVLDYRVSPLLNPDLDRLKLPPTLLIACEFDPIRDEALMYARRLERAEVKVELKRYQTYHGAMTMPNDGKQIRLDLISFLRKTL